MVRKTGLMSPVPQPIATRRAADWQAMKDPRTPFKIADDAAMPAIA